MTIVYPQIIEIFETCNYGDMTFGIKELDAIDYKTFTRKIINEVNLKDVNLTELEKRTLACHLTYMKDRYHTELFKNNLEYIYLSINIPNQVMEELTGLSKKWNDILINSLREQDDSIQRYFIIQKCMQMYLKEYLNVYTLLRARKDINDAI